MSKKVPKKLVVTFNVTGLSKAQIGALEGQAVPQGEPSDGQGGDRYEKGESEGGHPNAPFLGSKVVKRGKQKFLDVTFDVTGFTKSEIGYLASEVEVQAEENDAGLIIDGVPQNVVYPSVSVTSKVVEGARGSR
jgi:hypothetical protein